MRRSSIYFGLKYIVQCKEPGRPFYESMCAFNVDSIAIDYAKSCKRGFAKHYHEYRVIDHSNNEDKCIYRSDNDTGTT